MRTKLKSGIAIVVGVFVSLPLWLAAQTKPQSRAPAPASNAALEHTMDLASRGQCSEALPALRKALPSLKDKKYRYSVAMLSAQCGMSIDQEDAVGEALLVLNREFPKDPRVLYITTRYYSELANRTAQRLISMNPAPVEAQQLLAESYQQRGQYDDATAKYKKILEQFPNQPGIHYQLGRMILIKPLTPESSEAAKKEFEAELKVNPGSPAAEFMLGDLALRAQKTDEAIGHFTRATQLDAGLPQPYLGLGIAYNASGKFNDAIATLKKFVTLQPADPAGYYQLAIAYSRTGNKEEAERQMALQREAQKHWDASSTNPEDMMQPH
jgi:predicted Zn-dependent protease